MFTPVKAKEPFRFSTRLHLSVLTGLKATNLDELLALIKEVPGASIYHHTHRFLQQHQHLSPEPPNDFAYWVNNVLGEKSLGEQLASIDTVSFSTIRGLRDKIAATVEEYLRRNPSAQKKFVHEEESFHFIKSMSFIAPTEYVARDLKEFVSILKKVTMDSIYFHVFESRLRLEKRSNDFSLWIESSCGDGELANMIAQLDPYTQTLEDLRQRIIQLVEEREGSLWQKFQTMLPSWGKRSSTS
jgi:hypothetical protein